MTKITFIRHAESKYNAGIAHTHEEITDSKITNKGIEQARILDFHFDLLILSPLRRTMETYTNSNIKTKDVIISKYFREQMRSPLNFTALEENIHETSEQLENRVYEGLKYIKTLIPKYSHIGIITHYDYLRKLTKVLFGKEHLFNNCGSITVIFKD